MKRTLLLTIAIAAVLGLPVAIAQVGVATITGTVMDSSGAVIPGAVVTITSLETNFTFRSITNNAGLYRVPSLQPGAYRVVVTAVGFKTGALDRIELRAGAVFPADIVLQVGEVGEVVEVSGQSPLLETETSTMGSVVQGDTLYRLPLYQRWTVSSLQITPGVSHRRDAVGLSLGGYNVAGQRGTASGLYEDGVPGNDQESGTGIHRSVLNSVAEVRVVTGTLPAEYGHAAAGVVDVVKKTGTNEFHGLFSFSGRNRDMQHRRFFDRDRPSTPQLPNFPNGLGSFFLLPDANVGGPVHIPKLYDGRNKTFFFFGGQKLIEKKMAQRFATTPTPEMKAGDFSFGGVGRPIFDPLTTRQDAVGAWLRDPVPGNRIPLARFDPVARNILAIDPWVPPNQPDAPNSLGPVTNMLANEGGNTFFLDTSLRVDHQFSPYVKLFGSWTYNSTPGVIPGGGNSTRPINVRLIDFDGARARPVDATNNHVSLGNTWVISPTIINEVRLGYYRRDSRTRISSWGKDYGAQLGIPNLNPALMPSFGTGSEFGPDSIYGLTVRGPDSSANETFSFRNDLTMVRGSHSFKVGYELLMFRLNASATDYPSGDFRFDLMTAGLQPNGQPVPNTGNTFAGFLFGQVRQAQFTQELQAWHPRSSIHSFYLQDDWKATSTLTLNLGVRYTNESPYNVRTPGSLTNFDPAAIDPETGRRGAYIHPASALAKRDNNNLAPRIGLAWKVRNRWAARLGLSLNTIDVKFPARRGQFEEFVGLVNFQRAPGDPRSVFALSQTPPQQFQIRPNGTSAFVGTNFSARTAGLWDPNLRNPYAMNWHFSVQHEPVPNWLIDISYQGSNGVGLIEAWELNTFPIDFGANDPALRAAAFARPQDYRPFPHFGNISMRSNFGHSTHHAGTVKLDKRMTGGLLFSTFYTFSKTIDSQSDNNQGAGVAPVNNRNLEKAVSEFNRSHRFIFSAIWELPMGKNRMWLKTGVLSHVLGDWELAGVQTLESGNPLTFSFANSPYNYFATFAGLRRPDVVRSSPRLRDNWQDFGPNRFNLSEINPVIDINYFAYPAPFTPGNLGRNTVTGFPLNWTQLSIKRNFPIKERFRAELRWDMQNPFHKFSFFPPTTAVDFRNPQTFAKVSSDEATNRLGAQPLHMATLTFFF